MDGHVGEDFEVALFQVLDVDTPEVLKVFVLPGGELLLACLEDGAKVFFDERPILLTSCSLVSVEHMSV